MIYQSWEVVAEIKFKSLGVCYERFYSLYAIKTRIKFPNNQNITNKQLIWNHLFRIPHIQSSSVNRKTHLLHETPRFNNFLRFINKMIIPYFNINLILQSSVSSSIEKWNEINVVHQLIEIRSHLQHKTSTVRSYLYWMLQLLHLSHVLVAYLFLPVLFVF